MTIATAKNTPRNTYTASAGQTNFTNYINSNANNV